MMSLLLRLQEFPVRRASIPDEHTKEINLSQDFDNKLGMREADFYLCTLSELVVVFVISLLYDVFTFTSSGISSLTSCCS